jgi:hypothetical protein
MKLLVCGGRDYSDQAAAWKALDRAHAKRPITLVIHGDALGADRIGRDWAIERGIPEKAFPADWKMLGQIAGPVRNQRMLDEGKPDGVLALPGGNGTADMVRRAEAKGLPVWRPYGIGY